MIRWVRQPIELNAASRSRIVYCSTVVKRLVTPRTVNGGPESPESPAFA